MLLMWVLDYYHVKTTSNLWFIIFYIVNECVIFYQWNTKILPFASESPQHWCKISSHSFTSNGKLLALKSMVMYSLFIYFHFYVDRYCDSWTWFFTNPWGYVLALDQNKIQYFFGWKHVYTYLWIEEYNKTSLNIFFDSYVLLRVGAYIFYFWRIGK